MRFDPEIVEWFEYGFRHDGTIEKLPYHGASLVDAAEYDQLLALYRAQTARIARYMALTLPDPS